MIESEEPAAAPGWPDYRTVWRWHFYAGLFCIPFVVLLAISGSIYLFKTEIESWMDRQYDHLDVKGYGATAADQTSAAIASVPGSRLKAYELPTAADSAVRVIVNRDGKATRVYVHPESLQILKTAADDERFMLMVHQFHGTLLLGNRGSAMVELAASWAIIMIITGLYLWWPRGTKGLGGIVYPRLRGRSRVFWRDLHAVTGFWISGLALLMLLSGLPWAKFWGDYLKHARRLTGTAVARQDWTNGAPSAQSRGTDDPDEHSEHHAGSGRKRGKSSSRPTDWTAIDRIVATVRPLELAPPVAIAPPEPGSAHWTAKSLTPNRPLRVDLELDGATGSIISRRGFGDRHLIDNIVGTGIAAHEGRLFGWPNQMLGLITASGLLLLCASSVILWWRRRARGVLGAPKIIVSRPLSFSFLMLVVIFGIYLPLFGASLILVKIIEKGILVRIPSVRDWLGLRVPDQAIVTAGAAEWRAPDASGNS
jgi:uncharacterized iron-regulated membrane protein